MARPVLALTGVTGFVGRYVLQEALLKNYQVRALVRSKRQSELLGLSEKDVSRVHWIEGALGEQDEALVSGADVVIHIAGLIKARTRAEYFKVNSDAAKNLASAAARQNVKRFVYLSSMAANVPSLSDYAASKLAGEQGIKSVYSGNLAIIRAPAVFGPGDEATRPFFKMMQAGYLLVPGGKDWASRQLSLVFAPDLARNIVAAASEGLYDGQTVSPATIPMTTWQGLADMGAKVTQKTVKVIPMPMVILYPLAAVTSVTSYLFGIGHLTLGKLREFCYPDWSSQTLIPNATKPIEALRMTLKAYAAGNESRNDA